MMNFFKLTAAGMSILITIIVSSIESHSLNLIHGILLSLICGSVLFCALCKLDAFDFPEGSFFAKQSQTIIACHFSLLPIRKTTQAIIYPFPNSKEHSKMPLNVNNTKKVCPSTGCNTHSQTHWLS